MSEYDINEYIKSCINILIIKAHSLFQCLSQEGICLHAVQCNYICLHHVTLIYKFSVGGP